MKTVVILLLDRGALQRHALYVLLNNITSRNPATG